MDYKFFKEFPLPQKPVFPEYTAVITDFGAKENVLCSESIDAALSHVAEKGGGHVVVPKGRWKTGAIHLKSNTDLHFEDGAILDFSTNPADYLPVVPIVFEGIRCYNYSPFIYGADLENVSVTGKGLLEGNGEAWWPWKKNKNGTDRLYIAGNAGKPLEERVFGTEEDGLRSPFVQLLRCKNVLLEGFTLQNSPFWNIDPVWCENMIIRKITIESPEESPNTDGINVDSCKNALVEDCTIVSAGDDMFCLKAGRNADAREVGIPCENVVIRRCKSLKPSQSGGIVVGSEISAGVRNVLAEDCNFAQNINCIRLKSKDGRGGIVENMECRNIHMGKGFRGINLSYRYENVNPIDDPKEKGVYMPVFRNLYFENISCDETELGIAFDGIRGGRMENIHLKNITMRAKTCLSTDSIDGLFMDNVILTQI